MMMRLAFVLVPILSVGCAAQSGDGGDGDGDGDGDCDLEISLLTAQPEVGSPVFARAFASDGSFFTPQWSVRFDGSEVSFAAESADDREISFVPAQPGPYTLAVSGGGCFDGMLLVNAILPNANMVDFHMRMTPPGGSTSERTARIFGGGDYALGDVSLDLALVASGTVSDGATPIAANIRVRTTTGAPIIDSYSTAAGAYSMTLPDQPVDITILPIDPDRAPLFLADVVPAALADIDIAGADSITGVVSASGTPIAGAVVTLTIDGLPSSVGVTAGNGSYALGARAGGNAVLKVVPPESSGLPIAELALTDDPVDDAVIDVDFAAIASSAQTFTITEADGSTAAPGARVLFAADNLAAVASVTVGGVAQNMATGQVRRFAVANGAGQVQNLALTDAVYTVLTEPAAGGNGRPSLASTDTTGGATAVVRLAGVAVDWTADLQDTAAAAAVAGAVITARPVGLLSALAAGSATTQSDAAGAVSLPLIGGATYQLQIDPPAGSARSQVGQVTAPSTGSIDAGTITLPNAITITGRIRAAGGGGEPSTHVALYCMACPTPDIPVAEGVANQAGRFAIELPDPGVSQ